MKIICSRSDLLAGVNIVSKAVPSRTTMDILSCILIDASTDMIKLTANDMEIGIETKIEGTIAEKGMVAIDAKFLSDIVRKLPDNDVIIETKVKEGIEEDAIQTIICCEKSKFTISSHDGREFSFLPYVEKNETIRISEFTLKELIRQTIFSIAQNDSNPILCGELFEIRQEGLRVASLDSHRISIRNTQLKDDYPEKKVIVPGKTLSEITKILPGDTENEVTISFAKNHIMFEFSDTVVLSRLIEGNYLAIDTMLSNDYELKIHINRREMIDSIERATLLIKEGERRPVIFEVTDDNLNISIQSQLGNMQENVSIEKQGKDLKIGFNPRFFLDALRAIDEETVTLYMTNPKGPCFIKDEGESYIYLILPVNISGNR